MTRILAATVFMVGISLSAQEPLSRELAIERDLVVSKIETQRLRLELQATRAQLEAVSQALTTLLQRQAADLGKALDAEVKPIEDRLVRALGGDPAKGDRYDWQAKALARRQPAQETTR